MPSMARKMRNPRPLRVAVCASAFGFGPASKAAAILSRLSRDRAVETVTLASSISYEFLAREGYGRGARIDIRVDDATEALRLLDRVDLALVVLIPQWIPVLSGRAPVVYVDSLGFMWPETHYDVHPYMRSVDAYVVQDVFGAAERRFSILPIISDSRCATRTIRYSDKRPLCFARRPTTESAIFE